MSTKRIYEIAGNQLTIDVGSIPDIPAEVVVSSDEPPSGHLWREAGPNDLTFRS
jgi:hypothetical protein